MLLFLLLLLIQLTVLTFLIIYLFTYLTGGWYAPTPQNKIDEIFKITNLNKKDLIIDLGSGDGRVLISAAKRGIKSLGYELNPFLYLYSIIFLKILHFDQLAKVVWGSFWEKDLSIASVIFIFLPSIKIKTLEEKLKNELNNKCKIITFNTCLKNFKLIKSSKSGIFIYQKS